MNIGDMSVTFKLKKNATFQDGKPVTAKDVKWSLDRAVTVGGFPTFQMGAGSLTKPEQFVVRRRPHGPCRFLRKDRLTDPRPRRDRAVHHQFRAGQEQGDRKGPLGARIHQAQHRRQRRLSGDDLERRQRSHSGAQRRLEGRPAAEGAAHHLAHGAIGRQPPRTARTRRRRHLLRSAEQGFRRAARRRQAQHRVDALLERHPVHRHEREEPAVRQSEGSPGRGLCDSRIRRSWTRRCSAWPSRCLARPPTRRPNRSGRRRTSTTPILPRRSSCWPKPVIRKASRPRSRSTSALPASTSRSACSRRRAWRRSASRPPSTRSRARPGVPSSTRR